MTVVLSSGGAAVDAHAAGAGHRDRGGREGIERAERGAVGTGGGTEFPEAVVGDRGARGVVVSWFATQPGFDVVGAAGSAEEGLKLAHRLEPALMLVDLYLPGMDGLDFVRAVRQGRPEVRSMS